MWNSLWAIYLVVVIVGWLAQLWLAAVELRRARDLSRHPGHWPLEFPVYASDYYVGRTMSHCFRAFSVVATTAGAVLVASAALTSENLSMKTSLPLRPYCFWC